MQTTTDRSFIRSYLPWFVAAGALVLYGITLNRSLSIMGVPGLARVAGWDWHPVYHAPLYYLLTLPIRWLPAGLQLYAANAFSMICAVLTLALLARSVLLLPHDRTREQRQRESHEHGLLSIPTAWIPPLLAVLVCGLQLSFWELATVTTNETLDLLLFAYVIRCLLEYRVDGRESWISRMAFVYGVGVANNWAMIGFFPGFLIALVWIMGLSFFRYRFLMRTVLWGLAGLSLYLYFPLFHSLMDPLYGDFFQVLRFNLGYQKQALTIFRPYIVLLLGLTSLLPLFIISIRWPSSMGDISAAGFTVTNLLMYVVHGAFFLICLYTAFDPPFSPRQLATGTGVPLLTFYYVAALCIGYFCGYFLLVFGKFEGKAWERPSFLRQIFNLLITVAVLALSLGVPAALLYRNLPLIATRNSPALERYGNQLAQSLPEKGAVVLSDDPIRLHTVRRALGSRVENFILLDSTALSDKRYHRHLKEKYAERLPEAPAPPPSLGFYPPASLMQFMKTASQQHELYYLHPSFGYYFEIFHLTPRGLVYQMKPFPTNTIEVPPLDAAVIQQQEALWQRLESTELAVLTNDVAALTEREKEYDRNLQWAASYYSRACDWLGVQLQVNQQVEKAATFYQRALHLNPHNPCAFVNLEWNQHWQKNHKLLERFSDDAMKKLRPYAGNWDVLLSVNGPIDEPTFRLELAQVFARVGLNRQAANEVLRVLEVNPNDLYASIILGNIYVQGGMPDRALDLVTKIRSDPDRTPKEPRNQLDLLQIEAWAFYSKENLPRAADLLQDGQQRFSQLDGAFFTLAQMYLAQAEQMRAQGKQEEYQRFMTNGLSVFQKQLRMQPNNVAAWINHGGVSAQLEDYDTAVASLTRALELDPGNQTARLNRAISALKAGRYDEARRDYEALLSSNPAAYRAYYGLAEIAYRRDKVADAVENYDLYLKHAPQDTAEFYFVQKRLNELRQRLN